jgi:hypothetical protein
MSHPPRPVLQRRNAATSRIVGLTLLGSAIALAALAVLAYAGMLPLAPAVRGWAAAGAGIAAGLDALIGVYFLRAASHS